MERIHDRIRALLNNSEKARFQTYVISLISLLFALILEKPPLSVNGIIVIQFIYLILLSSMAAQLLMNWGMQYVSSSKGEHPFSA